jgi:hypothetical protein
MNQLFIGLWFAAAIYACKNNSGFRGQGESAKQPAESDPQPLVQPSVQPSVQTTVPTPSAVPPPTLPGNAVTKGSFSVWTTPAKPDSGQNYVITILVRLPSNGVNYDVSDLSGRVDGTDGYFRGIGRDSKGAIDPKYIEFLRQRDPSYIPPLAFPINDQFEVKGGYATVTMGVPGAQFLVSDRITVNSNLLQESQNITIVFGSNGPTNPLFFAR